MAEQRFKFKLFTSSDPDAQYAAITTKESLTFYLLNNGKGYLGNVKLFDASESGSGSSITLVESIASDATGTTTEAPSTKALVDYVTAKVSGLGVLTDKFFRAVKSHTITDADLTNTAISKPDGTQVGEVGLLFTADNDNADGDEQYYFVSLKDYLSSVYTFGNTDSITFTTDESNNVTANLKIADGEDGLVVDANGLHLNKVETVNESTPSTKLVTEDKMVSYVQDSVLPAVDTAVTEALKNVVTSEVDDGTGSSGSGDSGDTGGSGSSSSSEIYSTEETVIGTWIDGRPLYRIVIQDTMPEVTANDQVFYKTITVPIIRPRVGGGTTGIINCVNMYGYVSCNQLLYPINYTSCNNSDSLIISTYFENWISNPGNPSIQRNECIYISTKGSTNISSSPVTIIFEYTKTTDEVPTV